MTEWIRHQGKGSCQLTTPLLYLIGISDIIRVQGGLSELLRHERHIGKEKGMGSMYMIVGLGNPEKRYDNTRHNTGFSVIDVIAKEHGISMLELKHKAVIGKGLIAGERVILAKPQTYMNLSGESVRELVDYYKIDETEQLLVIYDDISMDVGRLRIRKKGSAGGHNGIRNIIAHLGHDVFARIKIGVGAKPQAYDLVDYVLGHFTDREMETILASAHLAEEAVRLIVKGKIDEAMNRYNKKQEVEDESTEKTL